MSHGVSESATHRRAPLSRRGAVGGAGLGLGDELASAVQWNLMVLKLTRRRHSESSAHRRVRLGGEAAAAGAGRPVAGVGPAPSLRGLRGGLGVRELEWGPAESAACAQL